MQNNNTNMPGKLPDKLLEIRFRIGLFFYVKIKKLYGVFLLFLNVYFLNVGTVDKIHVSNTISDSNGPDKTFLFGGKYTRRNRYFLAIVQCFSYSREKNEQSISFSKYKLKRL